MHHHHRPRRAAVCVALAVGVLTAWAPGACAPAPDPEPEADLYEARHGVYSEFLPFEQVMTSLDALAEHKLALYLAIRPEDVEREALAELLLAARARGVPVRAWLLLHDDDGYWPGAGNLDAFAAQVDAFWSWNQAEGLGVEWIVVDMEPPLEQSNALAHALETGDLSTVVLLLLDNRDPAAHEAARAAWADAVDGWRARGVKVALVALPYLLDDFADGDADLQDMFESPIADIAWDEAAFMVYQNLYGEPGKRLGPGLVRSYAETARERFGARAAVALGIIGAVGKNTTQTGYEEVDALADDLAAAADAGVTRTQLFSLDGALSMDASESWLGVTRSDFRAPLDDATVVEARDVIATLDEL